MRFLPTEVPGKVYEVYDSVTGYVYSFFPKKQVECTKLSPSTAITNGTVKGKKPVVLDGAIEKRLFPVEFEWTGPGDNVFVTGSFYNWTVKIPLNKKSSKFYARIDLPKGRHEFKFVINGVWKSSLRYPTVTNGFGDVNNYIEV